MSPSAERGRTRRDRVLRAAAAVLGLGSCIPMVAMLPGAAATVLTTIGIKTTSGPFAPVADVLAPVARPLLILATLALVAGLLRCGLTPAILAVVGGTLLFLSMYVLPTAAAAGGMAGMGGGGMAGTAPHTASITAAARAGAGGMTNAPAFYAGLASFIGAFVLSSIRRQRRLCRPALLRIRRSLA